MTSKTAIPNFDSENYGGDPTPEPLFYEELSKRSKTYDWSIKAHRHSSLYQFFLLTRGEVNVHLDDLRESTLAPSLIIVPPMSVHGFEYKTGSEGHVLSLHESLLPELIPLLEQYRSALKLPQIVPLSSLKEEATNLKNIMKTIGDEFSNARTARLQMLHSQICQFLVHVTRLLQSGNSLAATHLTENDLLAQRFRTLIDQNYRSHPTNPFLANELSVSVSRLAHVSQKVMGAAPQQILHNRILLEAKRLLAYTNSPVSEIGYDLGFSDPAYFSRFFKKMSGDSPVAFRKESD